MNWQLWTIFVVTELFLALAPGPAVLFVVAQSLGRRTRDGLWAAIGILAANTFYFVISATSLGALIIASYRLFFWIKWIGAGYLVYLGLSAVFGRHQPFQVTGDSVSRSAGKIIGNGFVTQVSNPKSLLFFGAILPQFVRPETSIARQIAILGVTSVVLEFLVLAGYSLLASQISRVLARPRWANITNRVAGGLLICAGLGVASIQR